MAEALKRKEFWLFGTPISHSLSPLVHNTVFKSLDLPHRYELHDTATVEGGEMLKLIRSETFGGAAVTMPLKVAAMKYVDELEESALSIGSINTIIVRRKAGQSSPILVGENYDWQGIRNALVNALPSGSSVSTYTKGKCGFIIGGGGTTRAGVYAFSQMGMSPIFLINRDPKETDDIIAHFPQYDLRKLDKVEDWTEEWQGKVAMGLGAIPSFEPVTEGEKNVYALATKIFGAPEGKEGKKRLFLEMCYKPQFTILLGMAQKEKWLTVEGLEPMLEQALAQDRAWVLDERSLASPYGGKRDSLGVAEQAARERLGKELKGNASRL